jgi:RNA polymerase sigma factor (sigma-70 family)
MPGDAQPNAETDCWFVAEILPHEAALNRYIRRVWSRPHDIADLRQEVYTRVYQSALEKLPTVPKAFLFTTARNLLSDKIRHGRIVSIDYTQDIDSLSVLVDELTPDRRVSARQELRRLSDAFDRLSDQTREIIWLRRVEGLSQEDAARRLGLKETTLAGYLSKGLRKLARHVWGEEDSRTSERHNESTGIEQG